MIELLLDIEKDLRECDSALANGVRHLDCVRDSSYFDAMEELGFIVNNKFLPIRDIFEIASKNEVYQRTFRLESVANGLSDIYNVTYGTKNEN